MFTQLVSKEVTVEPGLVEHTYNPSTREDHEFEPSLRPVEWDPVSKNEERAGDVARCNSAPTTPQTPK